MNSVTKYEAARDLLGTLPDGEVGRRVGVSRITIRKWREARGIAPWSPPPSARRLRSEARRREAERIVALERDVAMVRNIIRGLSVECEPGSLCAEVREALDRAGVSR